MTLLPDDLAKWSGKSSDDSGAPPYDFGYGIDPKAHTMQTVLGQNGPTLYASSGNCLLIPIYSVETRIGAIVHLAREDALSDEAIDLITKPFEEFPTLRTSPSVAFISSDPIRRAYQGQLQSVRATIEGLSFTPTFEEVVVGAHEDDDADFPMSVDIELSTADGTLTVYDDYGDTKVLSLHR